jgi:(p)ppGpp synthase/HD superfamily hydrolase
MARRAHAHQTDQQGIAYEHHLQAVADAVTDRAKIVAWFHDAIEDGAMSWHEIQTIATITEEQAIGHITRRDGETYSEFIERIATATGESGSIAREVKIADLRHNLSRMIPELAHLEARYRAAIKVLAGEEA